MSWKIRSLDFWCKLGSEATCYLKELCNTNPIWQTGKGNKKLLNSLWSLALHTPNNILFMEASKNCQVFVGWILKITHKCPLCLVHVSIFCFSIAVFDATVCVSVETTTTYHYRFRGRSAEAILTLAPFGVLLQLGSWKSNPNLQRWVQDTYGGNLMEWKLQKKCPCLVGEALNMPCFRKGRPCQNALKIQSGLGNVEFAQIIHSRLKTKSQAWENLLGCYVGRRCCCFISFMVHKKEAGFEWIWGD